MNIPTLTIVRSIGPIRPVNTSIGIARNGRFTRETALPAASVVCEWAGPKWVGPCADITIYWHKDADAIEALEHALVQTSTSRGGLSPAAIRTALEYASA